MTKKIFIFTFGLIFFAGNSLFAQKATVDVTLSPAGDFKATTNDVKGFATVVDNQVRAENVSVSLASLKSGISLRDKHMKEQLKTDTFPDAILLKAVGRDGKGQGKIKIKGITKIVSGTYKISENKVLADFVLNLSDFEIKDVQYMSVGVENEVTVHIEIPIK